MVRIKQKIVKYFYHGILHADDTPHRIALGVGIGTFVAFTPSLGFHMLIALALAAVLRANKALSVSFVWITNPVTMAPIYWFCWKVGAGLMPGGNGATSGEVLARLTSAAHTTTWSQMLEWSFWSRAARFVLELGAELWLGCCVVGLVSAGVLYALTRCGVSAYRRRLTTPRVGLPAATAGAERHPVEPVAAVGIRKSA